MLFFICNIIILVLLTLFWRHKFFNGVANDCFIEISGIQVSLKCLLDLFHTKFPYYCKLHTLLFWKISEPPVDKETFVIFAVLETNYLVMPTRDRPSCQIHGLGIGSQQAPTISNI